MVNQLAAMLPGCRTHVGALLADAAQPSQPLIERLDPQRRAMVIMVLLGLLLLASLLVAVVALGGRHMRRIARIRHKPSVARDEQWYQKPLVPPLESEPAPHEHE